MDPGNDSHFLRSSLREKVIEHLFLGELLRHLWRDGVREIGVLRSEVDNCGYDVVLECGGKWRHVQLKASHLNAKTTRVPVNVGLAQAPSGCVIWILFDSNTLQLGPYLWLGGPPSTPLGNEYLGERVGRRTRPDRQGVKRDRPNIRSVPRSKFECLETIAEVARSLFGDTKRSREVS
jgi:hypothetical protein